MESFTPISSFLGGALIGSSSALLLALNGKIAGISGIAGGLVDGARDRQWRFAFVLGLVLTGLLASALAPGQMAVTIHRSTPVLIVAGLLVGLGTRIGSGCTSGHGVCGLSRLSFRSLIATLTFMATAGITVYIFNHVVGG